MLAPRRPCGGSSSHGPGVHMTRDALSPREIADLTGFSYHAVLRAIRRGDLEAFEPVPGRLRIEVSEYHRWLHTPTRRPTPRPR
ncbi:MAG TPA: hypothetical protein VNR42_06515, partial [Solirubrobacteraceae bacterium]|nr:hypothetical protein [Solirubrobacteraceae bacterium]